MSKLKKLNTKELGFDNQILCCPQNYLERYRKKMREKNIPFEERLCPPHPDDTEGVYGEICFILPKKYRPHAWRLEGE